LATSKKGTFQGQRKLVKLPKEEAGETKPGKNGGTITQMKGDWALFTQFRKRSTTLGPRKYKHLASTKQNKQGKRIERSKKNFKGNDMPDHLKGRLLRFDGSAADRIAFKGAQHGGMT